MQELFNTLTVSDYFIDKSLIFARNNLKSDEFSLYSRLFHIISAFLPRPELLVYLYLDIPRLKENIRNRGREYEQNISPEYLEQIQLGYMNHFKSLGQQRVLVMDTSRVDFMESEKDYRLFLDLIAKQYDPGIHRIIL
jgi:deoxyadenosine/deoxycytidine kinase